MRLNPFAPSYTIHPQLNASADQIDARKSRRILFWFGLIHWVLLFIKTIVSFIKYIGFLYLNSSSSVTHSSNNVHRLRYSLESWASFNNHFPHSVPIIYQTRELCFNGKLWDPLHKRYMHVKSKYCHNTCPFLNIIILSFQICTIRGWLKCCQS